MHIFYCLQDGRVQSDGDRLQPGQFSLFEQPHLCCDTAMSATTSQKHGPLQIAGSKNMGLRPHINVGKKKYPSHTVTVIFLCKSVNNLLNLVVVEKLAVAEI